MLPKMHECSVCLRAEIERLRAELADLKEAYEALRCQDGRFERGCE